MNDDHKALACELGEPVTAGLGAQRDSGAILGDDEAGMQVSAVGGREALAVVFLEEGLVFAVFDGSKDVQLNLLGAVSGGCSRSLGPHGDN